MARLKLFDVSESLHCLSKEHWAQIATGFWLETLHLGRIERLPHRRDPVDLINVDVVWGDDRVSQELMTQAEAWLGYGFSRY